MRHSGSIQSTYFKRRNTRMKSKKFYDIHCHAMSLSHPNLLALIQEMELPWYFPFISVIRFFLPNIIEKRLNRIKNLLSVMENHIEDFFLLMEYYLKEDERGILEKNSLRIGDTIYNKIVLTPLIIDFGYKHIKTNSFYNIPPQKPIVEQVVDVFNAIKKYSHYELMKVKGWHRFEYWYKPVKKENKLFEIYPFLGINPQNYTFDQLAEMLDKYFDGYTGDPQDFYENMGKFDGDIESLRSNYFAGVKLYPPLGFDPWPESVYERTKAEYLYEFCLYHRIPITTHCSIMGFMVDKNSKKNSSPLKWEKILQKYPELKVNFAHFGLERNLYRVFPKRKWEKIILKLITDYPNVYVDFSSLAFDHDYYSYLEDLIRSHRHGETLKERVLFGSDFMINLIWIDSYNQYLSTFFNTPHISDEKERFCSINPERFLFEKAIA